MSCRWSLRFMVVPFWSWPKGDILKWCCLLDCQLQWHSCCTSLSWSTSCECIAAPPQFSDVRSDLIFQIFLSYWNKQPCNWVNCAHQKYDVERLECINLVILTVHQKWFSFFYHRALITYLLAVWFGVGADEPHNTPQGGNRTWWFKKSCKFIQL